jgi:UDP-2,3-diacylglucosamine hydrolase
VMLLGDVFELWVGDDMASRPFEAEVVASLAQAAARGLWLGFMVGNRDFLAGAGLCQAARVQALADPCVLHAFGQRWLLSHGDAWCLADEPYQVFRQEVRSAGWQQHFLARPLPERLAIAQQIRSASRERQRFDGAAGADVDLPTACTALAAAGASVLVHGHTHRPQDETLGGGLMRHVLSDWDLDNTDGSPPRAQVLRLNEQGLMRLQPC